MKLPQICIVCWRRGEIFSEKPGSIIRRPRPLPAAAARIDLPSVAPGRSYREHPACTYGNTGPFEMLKCGSENVEFSKIGYVMIDLY